MPSNGQSIPSLAPKFPLTILLVEDNLVDAELCIEFLSGAQFDVTADVVNTREDFADKLRTTNYDIVLADYHPGVMDGHGSTGHRAGTELRHSICSHDRRPGRTDRG
jgi:CheY-like chemotaxis protein